MWKPRVHGDLEPAIGQAVRERGDARGCRAQLRRVVVGEEEDAHEVAELGGETMSGAGGERERIERVYRGLRTAIAAGSGRWDAQQPGNAAIREEVLRALLELVPASARRSEGTLLDAGCGTGWWLGATRAARASSPSRLVGVELLAERVQAAARARCPGARVARRATCASCRCRRAAARW